MLVADGSGLAVTWQLGDGSNLMMFANLDDETWPVPPVVMEASGAAGRLIYEGPVGGDAGMQSGTLPPGRSSSA